MRFNVLTRMGAAASIVAATTTLLVAPAFASEPKLAGKHGDWSAYTRIDGSEKICYVLATPRSKLPKSVRHGDIYFMVANWRSGQASEQPSLLTGYPLHEDNGPQVRVGNAKINMFVDQNEAFIEDGDNEVRLVRSMRKGSTMKVSAVSKRGTNVTYEFSLKGITAALKKAKQSCA
ncbi:MAG: invasion associated locus B family protein [Maricaulaceae bacterium]